MPPLYIQKQKAIGGTKQAILSAVGFSGHGKTVYLATLLHEMENRLTHMWPKFYRQALNLDTVKTVQENLEILEKGNLPESTRRNFPKPSIHLLKPIPQYGDRVLMAYDPPGEAFDNDELISSFAHFIQCSPTVLFLISFKDLPEPRYENAYRLLNTYILGMARLGGKTKNQHIIIAFTKADQLLAELEGYPLIYEHLSTSSQHQLSTPKNYLKTLKAVSEELTRFTLQELHAQALINLAEDSFKSVNFCVVSALGSAPENGHLSTIIQPKCVVDPLIWVLEKS
ncbi:MAG: hypothetical protein MUC85_01995 [Anaerolineales bacterium]|nr:hypothetical protein [Anaerolineales bacterium]